jgi:dTDP-4-dehydrorhamnose 3,5-epimerase
MKYSETRLRGAFVIDLEPKEDDRGHFARVYCEREFGQHGLPQRMVQASMSFTRQAGTLRGMHYQAAPHAEDKLVCCVRGAIWDAIVDLRPQSPTYCEWIGVELTESNGRLLLVPKGFAHGFVTLVDDTRVSYQMSQPYAPAAARGARHDDPAFGIRWPVPVRHMSAKDRDWPDFVGEARPSSTHSTTGALP